jgi:hypothetical protein
MIDVILVNQRQRALAKAMCYYKKMPSANNYRLLEAAMLAYQKAFFGE